MSSEELPRPGSEGSDAWLGDILDDVADTRGSELELVTQADRARVADLLFLDALLERVLQAKEPARLDERKKQMLMV